MPPLARMKALSPSGENVAAVALLMFKATVLEVVWVDDVDEDEDEDPDAAEVVVVTVATYT